MKSKRLKDRALQGQWLLAGGLEEGKALKDSEIKSNKRDSAGVRSTRHFVDKNFKF